MYKVMIYIYPQARIVGIFVHVCPLYVIDMHTWI